MKFDLEFDLKSEISDGKDLVKFWGRTFLPARKAQANFGENFGATFGANFGDIFGNFVSNFAIFFRKLRSAEGQCKHIRHGNSAIFEMSQGCRVTCPGPL